MICWTYRFHQIGLISSSVLGRPSVCSSVSKAFFSEFAHQFFSEFLNEVRGLQMLKSDSPVFVESSFLFKFGQKIAKNGIFCIFKKVFIELACFEKNHAEVFGSKVKGTSKIYRVFIKISIISITLAIIRIDCCADFFGKTFALSSVSYLLLGNKGSQQLINNCWSNCMLYLFFMVACVEGNLRVNRKV